MEITVNDFLGMAFDNYFNFSICDIGMAGKILYQSKYENELPDYIGEMILHSWNLQNDEIVLNVDSETVQK